MKTISVNITENDIIKAIKTLKYSPIEYAVAKVLQENVDNVEAKISSIVIWNNDDSDYESYIYDDNDLSDVRHFIEEWNDFADDIIPEFKPSAFSFVATKQK